MLRWAEGAAAVEDMFGLELVVKSALMANPIYIIYYTNEKKSEKMVFFKKENER